MIPTFSPWCQMCLDGEDRGRIDAHELHVLRMKRERAKRPSKLRWQLEKIEPPAPGKAAQGEASLHHVAEAPADPQVHAPSADPGAQGQT